MDDKELLETLQLLLQHIRFIKYEKNILIKKKNDNDTVKFLDERLDILTKDIDGIVKKTVKRRYKNG